MMNPGTVMEECQRRQLIELLQREVVKATGCTEPGAVALCVAKAKETLGCMPQKVELHLSKNVYKNAMGVGIPGTGMIGLPIAVAVALTSGESSKGLQVLSVPQPQIEVAKQWLQQHADSISIGIADTEEKLYIRCTCSNATDSATAVIAQQHSHFVLLQRNGDTLLDCSQGACETADGAPCGEPELSAEIVYCFATMTPLQELNFINDTVRLNKAASDMGMQGGGLNSGNVLSQIAGNDVIHTVIARTVAASDARMSGCTLPIYSNSGSGNQGIACTLPVYEYGTLMHSTPEQITRALIMSHLMSIYIKRGIGRLSALCGIVNASIGVSAALTYLKGGTYEQIGYAVKNMINTISGMICDGAKPSCALKMATGVYSAFVSAELAIHNHVVDATDGLSECDTDCSIRNLCRLGCDGMSVTDDVILDIMTHKNL